MGGGADDGTTRGRAGTMTRERAGICELGPCEGLQEGARVLAPGERVEFVQRLAAAGLDCIAAGVFGAPHDAPGTAGTAAVLAGLHGLGGHGVGRGIDGPPPPRLPVRVAHPGGLAQALAVGAREIELCTGATDGWARHALGCDVATSLGRLAALAAEARAAGLRLRGHVSVAFGCPYEGAVAPVRVLRVVEALATVGCHEVALGDTAGVATPSAVSRVLGMISHSLPVQRLAGHFHDTRGMAVANVRRALDLGLRRFDAAVGGLGGSAHTPGAPGNLPTESLAYLLEGEGFDTGVDAARLAATGAWVDGLLGRRADARVQAARAPAG